MAAEETPRRLLGQLLVEAGVISSEELEQALTEQERSGNLLGEIILERGLASRYEIASALAEQSGLVLEREPGFGSGLLDEIRRRKEQQTEPSLHPDDRGEGPTGPLLPVPVGYELLRVEPSAPDQPAPDSQDDPSMHAEFDEHPLTATPSSHLVFAPIGGRYELHERPGTPPPPGHTIADRELGGKHFLVVKLARSPLPQDVRRCAYLLALD